MDATSMRSALMPERDAVRNYWPVRAWIVVLALLVFAMICVGGATRLTDSGLSITEWKLILGVIPPLSDTAWMEAFDKYRQIPEYQVINRGMPLEEFKSIYWWEWGHRLLGRLIGFAFLIPFLWFWFRGRIPAAVQPRLVGMFALGGLQGLLGWYMVMSGLTERVDVSHYRLAAHLGVAVLILGYLVWLAMDFEAIASRRSARPPYRGLFGAAVVLAGFVYLQILLGALVAGLDAGQGYNTWPLMDGRVIPQGLLAADPWWINLFENAMTVQFVHRVIAYAIVVLAAIHAFRTFATSARIPAGQSALLLMVAVLGQAALGIWTLLAGVPIDLGLAHQAGAMVVLALALWHVHDLYRAEDSSLSAAS